MGTYLGHLPGADVREPFVQVLSVGVDTAMVDFGPGFAEPITVPLTSLTRIYADLTNPADLTAYVNSLRSTGRTASGPSAGPLSTGSTSSR